VIRAAALCAIAAVTAPPAARAEGRPLVPAPPPSPPDASAAAQAEDANFDEDAPRHGFQIAAAIGPAQQVGFKIVNSTGIGGGGSLRLGARATRWLSLVFEIDGTSYPTTYQNQKVANSSVLSAFGARVNVRDAVWVRAAVGGAAFSRGVSGDAAQKLYSGLGGAFGAGVDVMRRDRFVLSAELTLIGAKYTEGFVGGGFLSLGVGYE
jgi:hypothetical protein